MSSMAASVQVASGPGSATHEMIHNKRQWRKGASGFAELHCGRGHWVVSDYKNADLDTCHVFRRLDRPPAAVAGFKSLKGQS